MKKNDIIELRNYSRQAEDFASRIDKSFDFNLPRDGDPSSGSGVWQEEIKAFADAETLKSLFFSEDWVYICVDLAANKLSSVPLNVVRKTVNDDGTLSTEIVNDHGLVPLIQMPNPWQEYPSWMYNYAVEDTLMGNAVNWFAERNGHLIILPADQISVQFNEKNELDVYKLSVRSADQAFLTTQRAGSQQALSFPAKEIIHTRRPNPASLLWGLSPFTPGSKPILFNRYSSDYLNSFYLKQATPAMAITMDRTVNEDLALRQLASFEMAYTGRRNQRRTLMLPKGTDAKPLTHTLADQRLVDMIDKNREVIINLLKVPKHELGLQTAGSLGSEEHKIALRNFWEATLIPMGNRIQGSLTQFFRRKQMLAEDEFFEFDYSGVDALKDDLMKKAEIAEKMAQTLPLNTVIQNVWEEEPIEDPRAELPLSLAPTGGLSVSTAPDELEEPVPGQGQAEEGAGGGDAEPTIDEEGKALQSNRDFATRFLDKHSDKIRLMAKGLDDIVDGPGAEVEDQALDLLIDFAVGAVKVVKAQFGGGKAMKADLPPSKERAIRRALEEEFDKLEKNWEDNYVTTLGAVVDTGFDQQLAFGFDQEALEQIDALRARDEEGRKAILRARGLDAFAHMSGSTSDKIITEIKRGVENNETLDQLTKRVAEQFRDPEKNLKRAKTIARTEALTATSIGHNAAYENAQEVIPDLQKVWINTGDKRVRGKPDNGVGGLFPDASDDHVKLQGERRGKNHPEGNKFSNGLEYPRDVRSDDPGKVINCRCSIIMVPPGDEPEGI